MRRAPLPGVWVLTCALAAVPILPAGAQWLMGGPDREQEAFTAPFVDPWIVVTLGRAVVEFPVAGGSGPIYRVSTTAGNARTFEIAFTLPRREGPLPRLLEISLPNGGKVVTETGEFTSTVLAVDATSTGRLRIRPPLARGVFSVRIVESLVVGMDLRFRVGTPGEALQTGEAGSLVPYESNSRWE